MQRTRHRERLPLRRHPQLPLLTTAQREPVLIVQLLRLHQIHEPNRHIPDHRVLEEVPLVHDLDRNHRVFPVRAQEFVRRLPDRAVVVLEYGRVEARRARVVQVHFGEWVQVAGE